MRLKEEGLILIDDLFCMHYKLEVLILRKITLKKTGSFLKKYFFRKKRVLGREI